MSEHDEMRCDGFADVAAELSLGVLTGRERAGALAHLERCAACRETVRQLTMTGEQLLELLPAADPPAGFENRVLERLGIVAPGVSPPVPGTDTGPDTATGTATGTGPGSGRGEQPRLVRGWRRTQRATLATLVTAAAVVVAALGGWGLRAVTSPAPRSPLSSAALTSATRQDVGQIYYYDSGTPWVYMSVNMPAGDGMVTCQLEGPGGRYTDVGKFRLTQGHGAWGSPAGWSSGRLAGARLLAPDGTVLATAAFS